MIIDPANDRQCLSQLTRMSRELSATWLVEMVARRLGSPSAVVNWVRSLPQTDDDGDELVQFISCDVPQRVRLFPPDPCTIRDWIKDGSLKAYRCGSRGYRILRSDLDARLTVETAAPTSEQIRERVDTILAKQRSKRRKR